MDDRHLAKRYQCSLAGHIHRGNHLNYHRHQAGSQESQMSCLPSHWCGGETAPLANTAASIALVSGLTDESTLSSFVVMASAVVQRENRTSDTRL